MPSTSAGNLGANVISSEAVAALDPYQCIAKRNMKYANECTEVYLAKCGATELSDNFKDFPSLEVVWFNSNRLARLDHLGTNFRIREVYIQDNRLVSLSGITSFKFLRVLLARNNQLRNLDKQLQLLEKFAFLKKLDLFGNPVAEEPDYRLRLIYRIPQVEILDQRVVKTMERIKADEVVPNLDSASAPKPAAARRKGQELSILEADCRRETHEIKTRREQAEVAALSQPFSIVTDHAHAKQGFMTTEKASNRERWGKPDMSQDSSTPTPWEKYEMRPFIERHPVLQGKLELQLDDVKLLADVLTRDGIEEAGRVLGGDANLPYPVTRTTSLAASTGAAAGSAAAATRSSRAQLLHTATAEGNVAEIRRAVAKGADANDKSDATRMTPLIAAAAHGHLDAVKLLLELRGDPRLRSGDGNTALMVAALHGREEIAKLLHENEGVEGAPRKEVNIHELKNNASQSSPPHPVEFDGREDGTDTAGC
jgi:hypothetical protein